MRAALLTVQLIFATWPVAAKLVLETLEPFGLAWIRLAFAACAFGLLAQWADGPREGDGSSAPASPGWPERAEALKIAGVGLLGTAMNQLLFLGGLNLTEASHAAVLVTMIPVFAFLIALFTGREAFSRRRTLGVLLALGGALSLTGVENLLNGRGTALGDLLLVANSASYALYLVYSKPYIKRYGTLKVLAIAFGAAALVAAPFGAYDAFRMFELRGSGVVLLVYILLAPTLLAYLLNAWALKRADASTVAIYIYLQPIGGVLLAAVVLKEALDVRMLVSALVVLLGMSLVILRTKRTEA